MLSAALARLQLMLDRGERAGWFSSAEIVAWAAVAALGLYLFIAHTLTHPRPFLSPQLLRERNFALGLALIFVFGMLNFTPMTLLPAAARRRGRLPGLGHRFRPRRTRPGHAGGLHAHDLRQPLRPALDDRRGLPSSGARRLAARAARSRLRPARRVLADGGAGPRRGHPVGADHHGGVLPDRRRAPGRGNGRLPHAAKHRLERAHLAQHGARGAHDAGEPRRALAERLALQRGARPALGARRTSTSPIRRAWRRSRPRSRVRPPCSATSIRSGPTRRPRLSVLPLIALVRWKPAQAK